MIKYNGLKTLQHTSFLWVVFFLLALFRGVVGIFVGLRVFCFPKEVIVHCFVFEFVFACSRVVLF